VTARWAAAVLGAGGYIGQHFVRLLADHPWFDLTHLVGSERSGGRRLEDAWALPDPPPAGFGRRRLEPMSPARLRRAGVRLVFSALPGTAAGPVESACQRAGLAVFSNASAHRMEPSVPLLVPEVNADHLRLLSSRRHRGGPLVTNPNCTSTGLVLALKPLLPLVRPSAIHVATYQALSGAGLPGVASLAAVDNVIPFIAGEEEKVARESAWILGTRSGVTVRPATTPILAHCARVPVRDGHLEAVTVVARSRPTADEIGRAWTSFDPLAGLDLPSAPHPPLQLRTEPDRPQPVRDRWAGDRPRTRGMAVVVGRVRWTPPNLRFFVLSHNAVRGGAGGSVLNAELAAARGVLGEPER
jgi:aspartate-semialdehyde dehydrogenase